MFQSLSESISYLYGSSSSSSLSCHAISTDISGPLSPPLPIVDCFWRVFRATSSICTELLYVCSSWTSCLCSSLWRGPQEYITYKLVPSSPAVKIRRTRHVGHCSTWVDRQFFKNTLIPTTLKLYVLLVIIRVLKEVDFRMVNTTWMYVIINELLVLDWNTWNHTILCKLSA